MSFLEILTPKWFTVITGSWSPLGCNCDWLNIKLFGFSYKSAIFNFFKIQIRTMSKACPQSMCMTFWVRFLVDFKKRKIKLAPIWTWKYMRKLTSGWWCWWRRPHCRPPPEPTRASSRSARPEVGRCSTHRYECGLQKSGPLSRRRRPRPVNKMHSLKSRKQYVKPPSWFEHSRIQWLLLLLLFLTLADLMEGSRMTCLCPLANLAASTKRW